MTNELTGAAAWIVPVLLTSITFLLGLVVWFLRREILNNDKAHDRLERKIEVVESDVKKLLEGNVAWVRRLLERYDGHGA